MDNEQQSDTERDADLRDTAATVVDDLESFADDGISDANATMCETAVKVIREYSALLEESDALLSRCITYVERSVPHKTSPLLDKVRDHRQAIKLSVI